MSEEGKNSKFNNTLPIWGNEATMNLNPLILTNIQSSTYFKVSLFKLKTYHEVIDEIYYQVKHMEPWEMGSRKTSGQGMCGGVRGVGAGGIVSSFFCLLYKLYTLKLTRKQLNGLLNHGDSPYIRALGFMYIRYTQPPTDLYNWFEEYLLDEEEIDVKAGGGQIMTIGQMLVHFLTKLDWLGTLFPRIPVPIQKQIQAKLEQYAQDYETTLEAMSAPDPSANNKGQKPRYGGAGEQGRNNKSYDNRNHRGEGHSQGRGGGGGSAYRREDEGRARNYHQDDRHSSSSSSHRGPSKYSRSRSRSRSPPRSKYYDKDWAGGSSSDRYRRSPSPEERYSSYGRRGGSDRGRDDYYERDRESHKSHRRKY